RGRAMVEAMDCVAGFRCPSPQGAFCAAVDVRGALGGTSRGGVTPRTSAELAALILDEAEVAVVRGGAFGPSGCLRLCYA
ncbi:aminotransferase class I/II-fold pyridoxal phosphate-dependent enzyme, partial [Micrococcus sp. SIMBA_131]